MTAYSGKLGMSFQDKLTKQNELSRQMLVRELSKIEESEKSDIRMMETARQRFRSRYKNLGVHVASSGSDAIDVRMYETHNPGFCYHCTGEIKESGPGSLKNARGDSTDSYEVVRAMLLTNGEVDIDKVLCLHLLAAHTASRNVERQVSVLETSFTNKEKRASTNKREPLTGAWNNLLPCYVLELERDDFTEHSKHRGDRLDATMENETLENFQLSYERYVNENTDIVSALTANDRLAIMAPRILGKMPIISPHVYSLLGASHELRVKQAIAEGNNAAAKRYNNNNSSSNNKRSSIVDTDFYDVKSINADSFRLLEPEEDVQTSRMDHHDATGRESISRAGFSKIYDTTKNHSRRSARGSCYRLERGITMLKGKSKRRPVEELMKTWRTYETNDSERTTNDLVTIKPSYRNLAGGASKTSSAKSPFRIAQNGQTYSTNSIDSFVDGNSRYPTKKYRKSVYLNWPLKSFALRTEEYRNVMIMVNYQIQALVHSVLDVLERVNPAKVRRIVERARDTKKICEIFRQPEIEKFVESLAGQPLISSPESFVASTATAIDEIDARLESFIDNELIATTLELPAASSLESLVDEIRHNIFVDEKKKSHPVINESFKAIDLPTANESGESSKLLVESQRKEMPRAVDVESTHESTMKCKTERIVAANKSTEGSRVLDEFDKLEGKLGASFGKKNRNKIINVSTSTEINNNKSSSKIAKSAGIEKSQFKHQKIGQETGYLDPDRVILRRMTNEQRILVGRVCAALKTKRINNEGLIRERTPLAALITPVLSRESIKILTRGTTYSNKSGVMKKLEEEDYEKEEQTVARSDRLTGPVLAKVRRDIAEHETKRRLESFFAM